MAVAPLPSRDAERPVLEALARIRRDAPARSRSAARARARRGRVAELVVPPAPVSRPRGHNPPQGRAPREHRGATDAPTAEATSSRLALETRCARSPSTRPRARLERASSSSGGCSTPPASSAWSAPPRRVDRWLPCWSVSGPRRVIASRARCRRDRGRPRPAQDRERGARGDGHHERARTDRDARRDAPRLSRGSDRQHAPEPRRRRVDVGLQLRPATGDARHRPPDQRAVRVAPELSAKRSETTHFVHRNRVAGQPPDRESTCRKSGADGDRTHDLSAASAALSQLSYGPEEAESTREP